jgi:predicted lactoylglutathione lyase
MQPKISLLTLAVDNLERSVEFYTAIGFHTEGITGQEFEDGAVAFFDLQNGLRMALFPQKSLAKDAGLTVTQRCPTGFSLANNVSSRTEVDEAMEQAAAAGATIVKVAQDTFWGGYAGYFQDPDGNLWEVAWNPQFV